MPDRELWPESAVAETAGPDRGQCPPRDTDWMRTHWIRTPHPQVSAWLPRPITPILLARSHDGPTRDSAPFSHPSTLCHWRNHGARTAGPPLPRARVERNRATVGLSQVGVGHGQVFGALGSLVDSGRLAQGLLPAGESPARISTGSLCPRLNVSPSISCGHRADINRRKCR